MFSELRLCLKSGKRKRENFLRSFSEAESPKDTRFCWSLATINPFSARSSENRAWGEKKRQKCEKVVDMGAGGDKVHFVVIC